MNRRIVVVITFIAVFISFYAFSPLLARNKCFADSLRAIVPYPHYIWSALLVYVLNRFFYDVSTICLFMAMGLLLIVKSIDRSFVINAVKHVVIPIAIGYGSATFLFYASIFMSRLYQANSALVDDLHKIFLSIPLIYLYWFGLPFVFTRILYPSGILYPPGTASKKALATGLAAYLAATALSISIAYLVKTYFDSVIYKCSAYEAAKTIFYAPDLTEEEIERRIDMIISMEPIKRVESTDTVRFSDMLYLATSSITYVVVSMLIHIRKILKKKRKLKAQPIKILQ
ncbi:hypothetical protein QPL79_01605 [Ignisphaera sp. 4213-co]|uniref:Uncharacterized protein n=1 Tax=Ignisphaera cupida TaxID=3050454 RepID=A0ABD4Z4K6_9CREN|nr:hypothetical protein [Ignisphaera sp. 4213-co]MDK6028059.1 hypothetical protein [Ignisphaera sp. 4213-co]